MKKVTLIFAAILIGVCGASAKSARKSTDITDVSIERAGDVVSVTFEVNVGRKSVKNGFTAVYAPYITNGVHRVSLPAVVVQDNVAAISWSRHEWAAGVQESTKYDGGNYTKKGNIVEYRAIVPYQRWMRGADVNVEVVTAGYTKSEVDQFLLADNILMPKPKRPAPTVKVKADLEKPVTEQPKISYEVTYVETEPIELPTVAEILAEAMPFVLPAEQLDPEEPVKFYDDERDNSLTIYYKINQSGIDESFADNKHTLENLLGSIDIIQKSSDSKIQQVVVAGFASPDGPTSVNDQLAWERAVSVKKYIVDNTALSDSDVNVFNGSADWRGLRNLIEQDNCCPDKEQLLDIIDNHPVWDSRKQIGRLTLMRNLSGGSTYKYLARNIFPQLRNGTFIRVYFENE